LHVNSVACISMMTASPWLMNAEEFSLMEGQL